ncbi:MAG: universal stress protein [Hyphomonadaceae bacterium JAD_PAG50586_4]|nr:MAG: universal stress protein [Hyphomonadaceae bacterium JAD_PAG50586_4]
MGWQEFLVFADASEDGVARLHMATELTKSFNGKLEALVLAPAPISFAVASETISGLDGAMRAAIRKDCDATVKTLQSVAGGDVHVHGLDVAAADSQAAAARAARTADFVIFGQPEEMDGSRLDTDIFLGAVLEGGRPCLMLPRWINPRAWGKRALISWKGTPEAARAVQAALPFLKKAEAVRLCVANPRGEREGEDEASIGRVITYLLRHGVKVEEPVMRESWEGPDRMIVSEVEGFNADFLVLGAYEDPKWAEEIFGGVTARMVRDAKIPILMTH